MAKYIYIRIPLERAKDLSFGLSDLACWSRGFVTALPPDDRLHYGPMGVSELRDVNIILKGAISDFEDGKPDPVDAALTEVMQIAYRAADAARGADNVLAHQVAAFIHDRIVSARLKHKGQAPLVGAAAWPFPEPGE